MISNKTKYGLKALSYLVKNPDSQPITIQEIAEKECISQKFLESILLSLRKNGILGSKKGKGGGYYLLQKPKEVNLAKIMRILEGPIAMVHCVSLNYYEKCEDCPDEKSCAVNRLMIDVRDSSLKIYRNRTLEDLA
ncbi:MAG: transcriptional regulator [Flavobacteriales bacterium]|nr:MAG: transcriptional regulator [Flavobacteriales bacterium]